MFCAILTDLMLSCKGYMVLKRAFSDINISQAKWSECVTESGFNDPIWSLKEDSSGLGFDFSLLWAS